MTFLQLPSELTEEEKLLQRKYQKLKRKKKQVQALKAPKVETPPAPAPVKRGLDIGPKADAKEVAKKLLKAGAIAAIKAPERKEAGFVRKRGLMDRSIDRPGGYQPFSASSSGESEPLDEAFGAPSDPNPAPNQRPEFSAKYDLYSNFVSAKDAESIAREETLRERKRDGKAHYVNRDLPNQGNTVFVRGHGLTEASLRSEFSLFGTIVQITMEPEKVCAFVTFESIEEANKSIDMLNNTEIDNVQVHVSLARKQPQLKNQQQRSGRGVEATASAGGSSKGDNKGNNNSNCWGAIAQNYYKESRDTGKKDNSRLKRQQIVYDDIDD